MCVGVLTVMTLACGASRWVIKEVGTGAPPPRCYAFTKYGVGEREGLGREEGEDDTSGYKIK